MKKYLITFWVGNANNVEELKEELQKCNSKCEGSYVTIKITPNTEEFFIASDGDCLILCDNYEIIGNESDNFWFDYLSINFNGECLSISRLRKKKLPKSERYFFMTFPVLVDEWCYAKSTSRN